MKTRFYTPWMRIVIVFHVRSTLGMTPMSPRVSVSVGPCSPSVHLFIGKKKKGYIVLFYQSPCDDRFFAGKKKSLLRLIQFSSGAVLAPPPPPHTLTREHHQIHEFDFISSDEKKGSDELFF